MDNNNINDYIKENFHEKIFDYIGTIYGNVGFGDLSANEVISIIDLFEDKPVMLDRHPAYGRGFDEDGNIINGYYIENNNICYCGSYFQEIVFQVKE
jgi:hypothetical protein